MYKDCSQFPHVVNFSSVKKLMQVVKINKVIIQHSLNQPQLFLFSGFPLLS